MGLRMILVSSVLNLQEHNALLIGRNTASEHVSRHEIHFLKNPNPNLVGKPHF